jgi:acyl CoA:acetate/3-ketoacid CoA transferase beta subunit
MEMPSTKDELVFPAVGNTAAGAVMLVGFKGAMEIAIGVEPVLRKAQ